MNELPARLVMQRGPSVNQIFELTGVQWRMGRAADNDIVINDAEVSRHHAEIVRHQDGGFSIEDLGSTNGTFINSVRSQGAVQLYNQDTIDLGDSIRLQFFGPENETDLDDDTADLEPLPAAARAISLPPEPVILPDSEWDESMEADVTDPPLWGRRRVLIGCGCALLLLVCCCSSTLLFLDWYRQGELLYCGPLRSFFETILNLGPLEFSPLACP